MIRPSFLDYTPVSLAFGTSGLRGLVSDITDLETYINVLGTLRYLVAAGDIRAGSVVSVAGDLRPSTDRIMRAAARALSDGGFTVDNAGKIPTPALIAHTLAQGTSGVMVTGSHIPFDRNGIKINKSRGEILKSDEPGILAEVERVRATEYARTTSAFDAAGMLRAPGELGPVSRVAESAYVRRYLDSFGPRALAGLRVLVYQHSAVGRDILPHILGELGAEVCTGGRSDTFIPIDTENISDAELDRLEALVVAAEATGRPLSAVVSTDGDSDRPLVTAVLPAPDARGRRVRFLPGDLLGLVVAERLGAAAVVVPISSNDAIERRLGERGVLLQKSKIGSPYVIAGLDELRAHAPVVGWEANGGFLTGSPIALDGGTLPALPTRDATLPIVVNLVAAVEAGVGLGELWSRLPARFGRAGLLDNVPVAVSRAILAALIPPGGATEATFASDGSDGPFGPSRATLARFFLPARGFDDIVRINVLDGVRVYFRNGDVAHIRPSGNAPQLRIYANSDTQARADQIVALGLLEPNGILRELERAFA